MIPDDHTLFEMNIEDGLPAPPELGVAFNALEAEAKAHGHRNSVPNDCEEYMRLWREWVRIAGEWNDKRLKVRRGIFSGSYKIVPV